MSLSGNTVLNSKYLKNNIIEVKRVKLVRSFSMHGITIRQVRYEESLQADIAASCLVLKEVFYKLREYTLYVDDFFYLIVFLKNSYGISMNQLYFSTKAFTTRYGLNTFYESKRRRVTKQKK